MKSKLDVDDNFVTTLVAQWTSFIDANDDTTKFKTSLFNEYLRSTSRVLLSAKWATTATNGIISKNKDDLMGILCKFKEKFSHQGPSQSQPPEEISHYNNLIDRLVFISNTSWPQEITDMKQMENYKKIDIPQAKYFWKLEGPIILETRIEYLLRVKEYNIALSLLKLLLLIWKDVCSTNVSCVQQPAEEPAECDPDPVQHNSEMCSFSTWECSQYENNYHFKYLELFIVLLIFDRNKLDETVFLDEFLTAESIIKLTCRLLGKDKPKEDRISSTGWKGWNLKEPSVVEKIRSDVTIMAWRTSWRILKGNLSTSIFDLQSLYHIIYFLDEPDARPKRESKLNTEIFSSIEEIPNIDHVYALVDYIIENDIEEVDAKYDAERNELFLQLLISVMTEEVNRIRAVEHQPEASKDIDIIREMESHLSSKYCIASQYLLPYPRTSWEFLLTAFSLNPSQDLFNKLFITDVNVQDIFTNCDTNSELESTKLPPTLIEDINGIIQLGRISDLSWYPSLDVLIERCKEHINLKGQQIRKRREELKNLNIDFSNYTEEEEDDDDLGISEYEKAYDPKRFQKVKRIRGPYKKRLKTDIEIDGGLKLKRKVGRPKKNLNLNEGPSSLTKKKLKWVRIVTDPQGRVIQRGRGRPKNSEIQQYRVVMKRICVNSGDKDIVSQKLNDESKTLHELKLLNKDYEGKKRGRGRPKKILIENANNISLSSTTPSLATAKTTTTTAGNKINAEKYDQRLYPDVIFQKVFNYSGDSNPISKDSLDISTSSNSFLESKPIASSTVISTISTTSLSNFEYSSFSLKPVSILLKRIDAVPYSLPKPNEDDESDDYDYDSDSSSSSSISVRSDITTLVDSDDEFSKEKAFENTDDGDGYEDSDSDDDMSIDTDSDCQIIYEKPPPGEFESDIEMLGLENSSLESKSSIKESSSSTTTTTTETTSSAPDIKMLSPLSSNKVLHKLDNNVTITNGGICQEYRKQLLISSLNVESDSDNSSSNYVSYAESSSEDDEENPEIVDIRRAYK